MLAAKLDCIANRQRLAARDYYDLFHLLQDDTIDKQAGVPWVWKAGMAGWWRGVCLEGVAEWLPSVGKAFAVRRSDSLASSTIRGPRSRIERTCSSYAVGVSRQERLPSEQVIMESPLSFTGSAKRIIPAVYRGMPKRPRAVPVAPVVVVLLISIVWVGVLFWYLVWGVFLIPFRLFRRLQLKSEVDELRHRELLDAIRDCDTERENPPSDTGGSNS